VVNLGVTKIMPGNKKSPVLHASCSRGAGGKRTLFLSASSWECRHDKEDVGSQIVSFDRRRAETPMVTDFMVFLSG